MNKLDPSKGHSSQILMDMLDSIHTATSNRALTAAGLAIGTGSTTKVKIVNTVNFLSGGVHKSKTTAEATFTTTTHDIPANASAVQEALYVLSLDAAGAITITMGAIATGSGNAKLPERPVGTPIGQVRIAVAAGATKFTAGTDALSAGHLTVTYSDLGYMAPRFDSVQ